MNGVLNGRRLNLVELGKGLVFADTSRIPALGTDTPNAGFKTNKDLVRVINNNVLAQGPGPLGITSWMDEATLRFIIVAIAVPLPAPCFLAFRKRSSAMAERPSVSQRLSKSLEFVQQ